MRRSLARVWEVPVYIVTTHSARAAEQKLNNPMLNAHPTGFMTAAAC